MFSFFFNKNKSIPEITEKILFYILPQYLREPVMGDLQEEFFEKIVPECGLAKARWWYRDQVFKSFNRWILQWR